MTNVLIVSYFGKQHLLNVNESDAVSTVVTFLKINPNPKECLMFNSQFSFCLHTLQAHGTIVALLS